MNTLNVAGRTGMAKTIGFNAAVISLGILVSACDGTASLPTAATPTAQTPTAPTPPVTPTPPFTLSGVVFETTEEGRTPIQGVEMYCDSCGSPADHTFVYTDVNGFYSLGSAANGVQFLFVTKDGYRHPDGALLDDYGRVRATVNGDTRFDVELVRR